MPRPHRIRRFAKWIGLGLCVLILTAWPVSLRRAVSYTQVKGRWSFDLYCGHLGYMRRGSAPWAGNGGWADWDPWHSPSGLAQTYGFTWPWFIDSGARMGTQGYLPLWCPLLVVAIPTAFLHLVDRRSIPPGHCRKCAYDLTGNISGVCPECGTKIDVGQFVQAEPPAKDC